MYINTLQAEGADPNPTFDSDCGSFLDFALCPAFNYNSTTSPSSDLIEACSGGARRRRRRRPPTASRLKGPRKQKSFAYKLLKRGLANLMSPTSTSGVAPPLEA
ncbi:hypothetical protein EVAR_81265_1 [Eumeta japonica]|uniref:Uncharacterized protein n=1 Tax=Eumeta variegata TaxID=151549 RepID=A0A4C1WVF7_EUMVA|nr:hypothetical protein EVAR_81265_1 [Eumeta japonica]